MKVTKKSTLRISRFVRSRRVIIGCCVFAGAVILGAYVWWSSVAWTSYEKQYVDLQERIDTQLTATFSLQSDTKEEKQEKTARLSRLQTELEASISLCNQNKLVEWQQQLVGEYARRSETCRAVWASVASFGVPLKTTLVYLQQEHALAAIIAAAPIPAEVAETEFDGQLQAWRAITESVKNTASGGTFDTVKQSAIETTSNVVKAWEEVIAAHQAKDKTRYTKAVQELAAAYDKLGDISIRSTTELTRAAASLKEAYSNLK